METSGRFSSPKAEHSCVFQEAHDLVGAQDYRQARIADALRNGVMAEVALWKNRSCLSAGQDIPVATKWDLEGADMWRAPSPLLNK